MLRTSSLLSGLVLIAVAAVAAPKAKAETAWLGLVAGPAAGSEAVQAADIAFVSTDALAPRQRRARH